MRGFWVISISKQSISICFTTIWLDFNWTQFEKSNMHFGEQVLIEWKGFVLRFLFCQSGPIPILVRLRYLLCLGHGEFNCIYTGHRIFKRGKWFLSENWGHRCFEEFSHYYIMKRHLNAFIQNIKIYWIQCKLHLANNFPNNWLSICLLKFLLKIVFRFESEIINEERLQTRNNFLWLSSYAQFVFLFIDLLYEWCLKTGIWCVQKSSERHPLTQPSVFQWNPLKSMSGTLEKLKISIIYFFRVVLVLDHRFHTFLLLTLSVHMIPVPDNHLIQ